MLATLSRNGRTPMGPMQMPMSPLAALVHTPRPSATTTLRPTFPTYSLTYTPNHFFPVHVAAQWYSEYGSNCCSSTLIAVDSARRFTFAFARSIAKLFTSWNDTTPTHVTRAHRPHL